ncbi:quaternary ammonium compound efflux SMR transporter SugE [Microbulbifer thermotolerans]|uniref:quaternary ammonium compound efflux SMR transporter SugE n=1 Tax=Microbulbifer thermotolerans TaxID=252514 RepID=UPI00224B76CA|nr:quaternary ammonium compound efflux SMR transporter SugE [Microbulbifer thermotolerans]MCX2834052.1 quaternary ammonium compound efflux SMR transporter SugE [Microbulbifer thermotolerans]MCX2840535.1 quaternary ammonium compound efflux SMR transporter SugE [Microbulbifer thermotolerans]
MNWFLLFIAGLLEVVWAIGLKYSEGFTKFWPSIWTIFSLVASFILLGISLKSLPVGTAYAIWVGIGAVGTALFGMILFDEPASASKIVSLGLICIGIAGLRLAQT